MGAYCLYSFFMFYDKIILGLNDIKDLEFKLVGV